MNTKKEHLIAYFIVYAEDSLLEIKRGRKLIVVNYTNHEKINYRFCKIKIINKTLKYSIPYCPGILLSNQCYSVSEFKK